MHVIDALAHVDFRDVELVGPQRLGSQTTPDVETLTHPAPHPTRLAADTTDK